MVVIIEAKLGGYEMCFFSFSLLFQISTEHFLILHSRLVSESWDLHFLNNLPSYLEFLLHCVRTNEKKIHYQAKHNCHSRDETEIRIVK